LSREDTFVDEAFAPLATALAKAIPGLRLVYANDGDTPAGMTSYETLIAQNQPIPDAMRKRDDLAGESALAKIVADVVVQQKLATL
jgi:hypothetical protein